MGDARFEEVFCVAGVQTPAFVERVCSGSSPAATSCVAGVQTPAFVERSTAGWATTPIRAVSPGFRLRPSLSEAYSYMAVAQTDSVAGVQTPAFVERGGGHDVPAHHVERCRRGSDSGLR